MNIKKIVIFSLAFLTTAMIYPNKKHKRSKQFTTQSPQQSTACQPRQPEEDTCPTRALQSPPLPAARTSAWQSPCILMRCCCYLITSTLATDGQCSLKCIYPFNSQQLP